MNHIPYKKRREIYSKCADHWGSHSQILMAIEEMAELTKELSKLLNLRTDEDLYKRIHEEVADVTIMMEQLRLVFDTVDIGNTIESKLIRLEERLAAEGNPG